MDKDFYKNAADTLKSMEDLDPATATPQQFAIMGACLAFLADKENADAPKMEATAIVDNMETVQQEPSRMDMLLHDLTVAFDPYMRNKAEFMQNSTDSNAVCVIDGLNNILSIQRELFSALWRGANHDSERQAIREFFKWYAEKYKLK